MIGHSHRSPLNNKYGLFAPMTGSCFAAANLQHPSSPTARPTSAKQTQKGGKNVCQSLYVLFF